MWELLLPIVEQLMNGASMDSILEGAATKQGASLADNIAKGATSSKGMPGVAGDISQGNWGSALGGLLHQQGQPMQQIQQPQMPMDNQQSQYQPYPLQQYQMNNRPQYLTLR
jgi:hypothetical protein